MASPNNTPGNHADIPTMDLQALSTAGGEIERSGLGSLPLLLLSPLPLQWPENGDGSSIVGIGELRSVDVVGGYARDEDENENESGNGDVDVDEASEQRGRMRVRGDREGSLTPIAIIHPSLNSVTDIDAPVSVSVANIHSSVSGVSSAASRSSSPVESIHRDINVTMNLNQHPHPLSSNPVSLNSNSNSISLPSPTTIINQPTSIPTLPSEPSALSQTSILDYIETYQIRRQSSLEQYYATGGNIRVGSEDFNIPNLNSDSTPEADFEINHQLNSNINAAVSSSEINPYHSEPDTISTTEAGSLMDIDLPTFGPVRENPREIGSAGIGTPPPEFYAARREHLRIQTQNLQGQDHVGMESTATQSSNPTRQSLGAFLASGSGMIGSESRAHSPDSLSRARNDALVGSSSVQARDIDQDDAIVSAYPFIPHPAFQRPRDASPDIQISYPQQWASLSDEEVSWILESMRDSTLSMEERIDVVAAIAQARSRTRASTLGLRAPNSNRTPQLETRHQSTPEDINSRLSRTRFLIAPSSPRENLLSSDAPVSPSSIDNLDPPQQTVDGLFQDGAEIALANTVIDIEASTPIEDSNELSMAEQLGNFRIGNTGTRNNESHARSGSMRDSSQNDRRVTFTDLSSMSAEYENAIALIEARTQTSVESTESWIDEETRRIPRILSRDASPHEGQDGNIRTGTPLLPSLADAEILQANSDGLGDIINRIPPYEFRDRTPRMGHNRNAPTRQPRLLRQNSEDSINARIEAAMEEIGQELFPESQGRNGSAHGRQNRNAPTRQPRLLNQADGDSSTVRLEELMEYITSLGSQRRNRSSNEGNNSNENIILQRTRALDRINARMDALDRLGRGSLPNSRHRNRSPGERNNQNEPRQAPRLRPSTSYENLRLQRQLFALPPPSTQNGRESLDAIRNLFLRHNRRAQDIPPTATPPPRSPSPPRSPTFTRPPWSPISIEQSPPRERSLSPTHQREINALATYKTQLLAHDPATLFDHLSRWKFSLEEASRRLDREEKEDWFYRQGKYTLIPATGSTNVIEDVSGLVRTDEQIFVAYSRKLSPGVREVLRLFRADGLCAREAWHYILLWEGFVLEYPIDPYHDAFGLLPADILIFAEGLRLGFGEWKASSQCMRELVKYLVTRTHYSPFPFPTTLEAASTLGDVTPQTLREYFAPNFTLHDDVWESFAELKDDNYSAARILQLASNFGHACAKLESSDLKPPFSESDNAKHRDMFERLKFEEAILAGPCGALSQREHRALAASERSSEYQFVEYMLNRQLEPERRTLMLQGFDRGVSLQQSVDM